MRLKDKVSLALLICCFCLLALITLQRYWFTLPELRQIQHQADLSQVQRTENAIQQQIREIQRIAYDYGVWDDTYEFTQQWSDDYIRRNYVPDTFASLVIDVMMIYDPQGKLLWSGGYDSATESFIDPKTYLPADLLSQQFLVIPAADYAPGEPVVRTGILQGRLEPLLYTAISIHRSLPGQEMGGTFVVVRRLNQALLAELNQFSQVSFRLHTREEFRLSPHAALASELSQTQQGDDFLRVNNTAYRWLFDEQKKPLYLLQITLPAAVFEDRLIDTVTFWVSGLLVLSIVLLRFVLDYLIVSPIEHLSTHLRAIRETANYSLRVAQNRDDEIGELEKECNSLVHYVGIQEGYLRDLNHTLMVRTLEDGLTAIANRRHFDTKLTLQWLAFRAKREPLFVMLIDVDHFKLYNDHYGHPKGDKVLRKVAEALYTHCRMTTDTVARYGGEEFGVILTETNRTGAGIIANKLLEAVRNLNIPHAYSAHQRVTVSIGCAGWIPDERGQEHMLAKADQALYTAKQQGRDRIVFDFSGDSS